MDCIAVENEKSQPVNIPNAAKRKKKKRTRATDSSTGTFDGNKADIILKLNVHCKCSLLFKR